MKTRLFCAIWVVLVSTMGYIILSANAADNFVVGYEFNSATGLQTGANLEDMTSQARFDKSAFDPLNTNRLFDSTTITNIYSNGNYIACVANGGITENKLSDGSVSTQKIMTGAITTDKIATGAVDWRSLTNSLRVAASNYSYSMSIGGTKSTGFLLTNTAPYISYTGSVRYSTQYPISTNIWDGCTYTCTNGGMYSIYAWAINKTVWPTYDNWYGVLILLNSNPVSSEPVTAFPSNMVQTYGQKVSSQMIVSLTNGAKINFAGWGSPGVSTTYQWGASINYLGN